MWVCLISKLDGEDCCSDFGAWNFGAGDRGVKRVVLNR